MNVHAHLPTLSGQLAARRSPGPTRATQDDSLVQPASSMSGRQPKGGSGNGNRQPVVTVVQPATTSFASALAAIDMDKLASAVTPPPVDTVETTGDVTIHDLLAGVLTDAIQKPSL